MTTSRIIGSALFLIASPYSWAQDLSLFEEPTVKSVLDQFAGSIDERFDEFGVPGMSIALVHDQYVVWTKNIGFATIDTEVPVRSDTVFRIGSITKLFTATMLMQLQDDGLLRLDQSVEGFLPVKLQSPFADPRPVSFRQMASHTSGFPPEGGDYWQTMSMPSIEQLYEDNPIIVLQHPPFTSVAYSNFAVSILGGVLARIANSRYEDYVLEEIFQPLQMSDSVFSVAEIESEQLATGYSFATGEYVVVQPIILNALAPAGQAYSSAKDLAKFVSLQFRNRARGNDQVLGISSLREMRQPVSLFPNIAEASPVGFGMGVGWFLREIAGHQGVGHGGGIPGYTSDITVIPDLKLGIINLRNGGAGAGSDPTTLNRELLEKLIPAIVETKRAARLEKAVFTDDWEKYIGDYDMAGVATLKIIHAGEYLKFFHPFDEPGKEGILVPSSEGSFELEGGVASGETIHFDMDNARDVVGLRVVGILSVKK